MSNVTTKHQKVNQEAYARGLAAGRDYGKYLTVEALNEKSYKDSGYTGLRRCVWMDGFNDGVRLKNKDK